MIDGREVYRRAFQRWEDYIVLSAKPKALTDFVYEAIDAAISEAYAAGFAAAGLPDTPKEETDVERQGRSGNSDLQSRKSGRHAGSLRDLPGDQAG